MRLTPEQLAAFDRDGYLFFPALFKIHGHPVAFLPVNDRPRERGSSKYGNLSRAVVGLADLLGVMWLRLRSTLPAPRGPE